MDEKEREIIICKEIEQQFALLLEYFNRHIPKSADLEYIALRAHLLAEYYLNHLLILKCGSHKLEDIENLSFYSKVCKLKELNINHLESWVINLLLKLNKIRNNLSHSLEYKISEADIDSLGFSFGKEYIYRKFSINKSDPKSNFCWILQQIILGLYRPINVEIAIESIKRKEKSDLKISPPGANQPDSESDHKEIPNKSFNNS